MVELTEDQRRWLEQGLAGAVASARRGAPPFIQRIFAARAAESPELIEFCVVRSDASRMLENLAENAECSLTLVCPPTYRSLQFKGHCCVAAAAPPAEFVMGCLSRMDAALQQIGVRAGQTWHLLEQYTNPYDMLMLQLCVRDIFDQTPGPEAGARV